jgi:hypothetical protein
MKSLLRAVAALAVLCALPTAAVALTVTTERSLGCQQAQRGLVYAQAAPTAPATQNTVSTTGPVTSETTISVGTLAGQALQWVVTVFGAILGTAGTALVVRLFNKAGIAISDSARMRLQEMVVNGLNIGAKTAQDNLAGRGKIEIKNAAVASAVTYVQTHGADTLKQLGVDPNSNAAIDAIKARIETAIADPATPTPPVLNPVAAPAVAPIAPGGSGLGSNLSTKV